MSKKKFTLLAVCEIKSMWPIFKTQMSMCQSKANLAEKILFGKITHLYDETIRKMPLRESKIPHSIMVYDLCGIEIYIIIFRNRVLISLAVKSWTRIECGIFVPNMPLTSVFLILGL